MNDSTEEHLQEAEYLQDMREIYAETDSDLSGLDVSRRSSDLYSPELNLEAHRTAQEVYYNLLLCFLFNITFLKHSTQILIQTMKTDFDTFFSLESKEKSSKLDLI